MGARGFLGFTLLFPFSRRNKQIRDGGWALPYTTIKPCSFGWCFWFVCFVLFLSKSSQFLQLCHTIAEIRGDPVGVFGIYNSDPSKAQT